MIGVYLKISRYIEKEKDKDKNHHKNNKYVLKIPPTHPPNPHQIWESAI